MDYELGKALEIINAKLDALLEEKQQVQQPQQQQQQMSRPMQQQQQPIQSQVPDDFMDDDLPPLRDVPSPQPQQQQQPNMSQTVQMPGKPKMQVPLYTRIKRT